MKRITDKAFRYANATSTAKPGYLLRKWTRLYPGCFTPPPKTTPTSSVVEITNRKKK